jgi:hypothetical protein
VVPKALARPVMLSANAAAGPKLGEVVSALEENGIAVESKQFEV